ncbi:SLBB domain-containing protein [Paraneptunicella aestuarii]|uniref:SLBB domain-containing protein n=1 Tax=Paraneptunicella aestuarii TaxID=2831148 RepID=UPI001E5F1CFB|nr:SLBB domain-containing protein [Paraneptunicella aestuarii]UAA39635.1 SLBB domain-containing protein [Paraneptunicella aestuarii]
MKNRFGYILCLFLVFSPLAFAQQAFQPTKEQLEIFKKLSPEQQEALAKKYGMDLNMLGMGDGTSTNSSKELSSPYMLPRADGMNKEQDKQAQEYYEQTDEEEDELKPFGYDLFAGQPTTFSPLAKAPVPSNHLMGLGDKLLISLYGKVNEQYDLEVNRQGQVVVPGLPPMNVAGLTYSEAKDFIKQRVEEQNIGVSAHVAFGELGSIQVFVLGDAYTPGTYTVSSLSTITHALFASGGIKEIGSLRNIQLKRAGKVVVNLDLYDLLLRGDTKDDVLLRSGDVVFIPSVGKQITVDGAVNRPAIYEVKPGETFKDLLAMVGGPANEAYLRKVSVYQYKNGTKHIQNVDLNKSAQLQKTVENVAQVIVPNAGERLQDAIQLLGEVTRPGFYEWYEGISLLSLIDSETGFFTEHSDINYGLLLRRNNGEIQAIQFSPAKLLTDKSYDKPLMPEDKLFIFSTNTKSKQLLSFEELTGEESKQDLIKERVEKQIEEQFFWDLYANLDEEDDANIKQKKEEVTTDLPTLFELENESFSELVEKYKIYRWDTSSRHYLLWPAYKMVLDANRIGSVLPLIEVSGNVRYPGAYPLSEGGSLEDALDAAGGVTDLASPMIKVSRETPSGVEQFDVNIKVAKDFLISGKDKISVFTKPEANDFAQVQIRGEVKFPGTYTVKRGELLSSLIAKAGGLTKYAHADGAVFTRESLKSKEKENLLALADELRKQVAAKRLTNNVTDSSNVNYNELQKVLADLTNTEAVGRMVIDLPSLLEGNLDSDVELIRGDILVVPPRSQTVSVVGEVYLPTSHRYRTGLSIDDYLDSSGGVKKLGDEDNVFVIQANGSVIRPDKGFWYSSASSSLKPGDTIVVPLDANPIDNLTLWSSVTQILYQSGVAIAAIGSL